MLWKCFLNLGKIYTSAIDRITLDFPHSTPYFSRFIFLTQKDNNIVVQYMSGIEIVGEDKL